jgi:hypothetical protein
MDQKTSCTGAEVAAPQGCCVETTEPDPANAGWVRVYDEWWCSGCQDRYGFIPDKPFSVPSFKVECPNCNKTFDSKSAEFHMSGTLCPHCRFQLDPGTRRGLLKNMFRSDEQKARDAAEMKVKIDR